MPLSRDQSEAISTQNHAQQNIFEQKQQERQQSPRIYQVTDGLHSKHTKTNYCLAFGQFLRDGARTTDLQVLLDHKPKVIEQMIIGYIEQLRDKGRSHKTITMHCAAVFYFFSMNDVVLNRRKIMRFVPPEESSQNNDNAYSVEEINQIIQQGCGDVRSKVIVLLMAATGMRLGAIPGLRVGDLQKVNIPDPSPQTSSKTIYVIWVYARTKTKYYCFATPELTSMIDAYLYGFRERLGERITDKSPLIREMFDSHNRFIINAPKLPTERMIQLALEQALKRAGVNQRTSSLGKAKRREIMRSHGFRKHWVTQMIKAKVDYSVREFLVGHKVSRGLDFNYDRTSVEDRLQEFVKAIPLLTIDRSKGLQTRVKELETEQAQEIVQLRQRDAINSDAIANLSDKINQLLGEVQILKQRSS